MAQLRKPRRVTTDKQREAARRNGAASAGPKSEDGKKRSAQNAVRHGLASELVVLTIEERPLFENLLARYIKEFQPQTEFEHDLVEEMAVAKWRQRRIWAFQTATIDARIERMADQVKQEFETIDSATIGALAFAGETDSSASLALMQRYESMYARHFRRAWRDLESRQNPPKQKLQNEPDKDLTPADPTNNGAGNGDVDDHHSERQDRQTRDLPTAPVRLNRSPTQFGTAATHAEAARTHSCSIMPLGPPQSTAARLHHPERPNLPAPSPRASLAPPIPAMTRPPLIAASHSQDRRRNNPPMIAAGGPVGNTPPGPRSATPFPCQTPAPPPARASHA